MRKVVNSVFGYRDPKAGEDFTDIIFSKNEYNQNLQDKRNLQDEIEKLKRAHNSELDTCMRNCDKEIAKINAESDKRVAEAQNETNKQKNKADSFENINKNLIRVATERANAKRELTPKKQHIGYVFLSVEDYIYNCECVVKDSKKTMMLKLPCFRIRLQSPYDVALEQKAVKDLIYNDFLNKIMHKINVDSVYRKDFGGCVANEVRKVWSDTETFMFKLVYKANFQKGLWEVEFFARDMPVVPHDMTINKESCLST